MLSVNCHYHHCRQTTGNRYHPSNRTSLKAPATEFKSTAFLTSSPPTPSPSPYTFTSSSSKSSTPQLAPSSTAEPSTRVALAVRELDSESTVVVAFLFSLTPAPLPCPSSAEDSVDPVTAPRARRESLSSFSSSRRAVAGGKPVAVAVAFGLEEDAASWALRRLR